MYRSSSSVASVLTVRSRLMTSLAVALLALLLVACGGSHSTPTTTRATSPIPPPPDATGPPTRAALEIVRNAAAHTLTQKVVASIEVANRSSVTFPVIKGPGSFNLGRATGQVSVENPLGFETFVYQPGGVFDRPAPGGATSLPQGRPWIRIDFKEPLKAQLVRQFLLAVEAVDPGFFLDEVAWGATTAAPLGPRVVNHEPALGYLVRVDPARAAAVATGPRAHRFVRTATLLERIGRASDQTVRVWVDRSGRIVAIRGHLPAAGIGDTLMTINSFGALSVQPAPPARNEFIDLLALTKNGDNDGD